MEQSLFVGTYSKNGIYNLNFNNGILTKLGKEDSFENCSYLCTYNNIIYSIVEYSDIPLYKDGYVVARNKNMLPINSSSLIGKGPCFITLDKTNNLLYVGNYGDGSIDIFSLNTDGSIHSIIYHNSPYSNNSRIHYISLSNNLLFAIDLGVNKLFAYKIVYSTNNFKLKEFCYYDFPNGSAPRHFVQNDDNFYIITENSCELYKLKFSLKTGFKLIDTVSLLPNNVIKRKDYTGCAIKMSTDNNFIYTSIRGHNSISVFKLDPTLELIQNISCFGTTPRDIYLDSSQNFLLCANQTSNNISIFNMDTKIGYINFKSTYPINSPACIIPN